MEGSAKFTELSGQMPIHLLRLLTGAFMNYFLFCFFLRSVRHILQLADPTVHGHVFAFFQLQALTAAGIYRSIGVYGGFVD